MCIQGKCQRIGCDLEIGSSKKIDSCGVCGGDSSSCSQPLYYWETAPTTQCSLPCGEGYKMFQPVCRNRVTSVEVGDLMCSGPQRSEPSVLVCNTHTCPHRWITDDWSPRSRLCGPGYRERMMVCAKENNGIKTTVLDMTCRTPKPATQEPCMIEKCPTWGVEDWTGCSVTCGQGLQMRGVECKSSDGRHSAKCDPLTKPISVQQCSTGVSCDGGGGTIILGSSGPLASSDDGDLDEDDEEDDDDSADVDDVEGGADDSSDVRNGDADLVSYHDESAPQYAHRSVSHLHHEEPQQPRAERLTGGGGGGGYSYHSNSDPESEVPAGDPSSQNTRRKQQGARESNRRSKNDQTQSVDGDILENEQSQLVQQVGENGGGAPKSTSASNGGSRANVLLAMPYFQALLSNLQHLWPFQKLGKSTGHRMLLDKDLQFGIDLEIFEQDGPLRPQIDTKDLLTLTTSDTFASSSLTAAEDTNDGSSTTNIKLTLTAMSGTNQKQQTI